MVDWCSGGGAADLLATAFPACMIQLAYGIRMHRLDLVVRYISQEALRESCNSSMWKFLTLSARLAMH
jgi:hypothetical protein